MTLIPSPRFKRSLGGCLNLVFLALLITGCENQLDNATRSKIEQHFGNTVPQAVAGLDQTVVAKSTVLLDGSASRDNEGALTQYHWRQISGSPVTLNNSNTRQASFIAPDLTANTTLTFELVVTDNQGWPASDTINISVTPSPAKTAIMTGTFIASPKGVSGLSYQTATQSGMTNAAGEFKYLEGESVSFNVGGIQLGKVLAKAQLSPFDLVGIEKPPVSEAETSKVLRFIENNNLSMSENKALPIPFEAATNIAAFLQALDEDSNVTNGITIPALFNTLAQDKQLDFKTHSSRYFNYQPTFRYLIGQGRMKGLWGGNKPLMNYAKVLDFLYSGLGLKPTIPKVASDWRDYTDSNTLARSTAEVYDFDETKQQLIKKILFYRLLSALPTDFDMKIISSYNPLGSLATKQEFIIDYDVNGDNLTLDLKADYNQNNWITYFSHKDIDPEQGVVQKYTENYDYNSYGYLTSVIYSHSNSSYVEPTLIMSRSHDYSYTNKMLSEIVTREKSTDTTYYLYDALGRSLGYSTETKNDLGKIVAQSSSTMDWSNLTKTITFKNLSEQSNELVITEQTLLKYDPQWRVIDSKKFKDTNSDKVWDAMEAYQANYDNAGNRTYYAQQLDNNGDGKVDQNKREILIASATKITITQEQDNKGDGVYNLLSTEERALDNNGNWISKMLTKADATTTYQERGYKNYSTWFPLYPTGAESNKELIAEEFFINNGVFY